MTKAASSFAFMASRPSGAGAPVDRMVAEECPVALDYNGMGYAVLMATPADLEDLAYGFSLSERLIDRADQILTVERHDHPKGVLLRIALAAECADRVLERVRHRVAEGSCGLCGIENLDQAMRTLPRLPDRPRPDMAAIFTALDRLRDHQPLNALTGAVHAAALCDNEGTIRLVREDVGRHNGFDKLIGAMMRGGIGWDGGFALLSSRCSYELVEKAVLADCPLLATISAPTSLALERAQQANLPLVVLARADAVLALAEQEAARPERTGRE